MQLDIISSATRTPARAATLARGGWMQRAQAVMGTTVSVQLWAEDRSRGVAAMAAVMAEMQRIERAFSVQRPDSELALANAAAHCGPVRLSDELFRLLVRAVEFSRLSSGSFDISLGAVAALYDYRAGVAPGDAELARAMQAVGWQQLELDPWRRSLRFRVPGVRIDLGGFVKGHAIDASCAILARHGIRHALVSAGSDNRIVGDRRGKPWSVAVRDPRDSSRVVALLPLADTAVATSGDFQRFFESDDGVRHHPVIDPRSGRAPNHVRSVTVLAPDGLSAEALAKAVFVLGVDAGLAIVQAQPASDAVVVDGGGELHFTRGLSRQQGDTVE